MSLNPSNSLDSVSSEKDEWSCTYNVTDGLKNLFYLYSMYYN